MSGWDSHLILAPIVLPLAAGALLLLLDQRRRRTRMAISMIAALAAVAVALLLLRRVEGADGLPSVYLLGNWPAPFGIVLVLDRLSALMLMLAAILALAALTYALARWHRDGVHFHPLFQFLLMGINGAFLTGDLFNLFVFFEVMLAASYGLVLHGSGAARIRAGMHYIVVNLFASLLFLIGVSLIYGVSGTLNMADLALRIPGIAAEDRMLLEAGAAILGVAFLVKAGMWPLGFWLPGTYKAASAPAASIAAILSKVGVYVVLRLWLMLFGDGAGASAQFGEEVLLYGGMMTVLFGMVGVLAAQDTASLTGYAVLVSSGTLLAAIGVDQSAVTAGLLFYLVSSTLTFGALYLLIELAERGRILGADMLAVTREAYGEGDEGEDPDAEEPAGPTIPAALALLGAAFLGCAVLVAGMPPLSGFIAKFAILDGLFRPPGGSPAPLPASSWALVALVILSGLASLVALVRAGIRTFWGDEEREVPAVRVVEMAPILGLLLLCAAMTVQAGPVLRYMERTAQSLHSPQAYVEGVLGAPPAAPEQQP